MLLLKRESTLYAVLDHSGELKCRFRLRRSQCAARTLDRGGIVCAGTEGRGVESFAYPIPIPRGGRFSVFPTRLRTTPIVNPVARIVVCLNLGLAWRTVPYLLSPATVTIA